MFLVSLLPSIFTGLGLLRCLSLSLLHSPSAVGSRLLMLAGKPWSFAREAELSPPFNMNVLKMRWGATLIVGVVHISLTTFFVEKAGSWPRVFPSHTFV